TSVVGRVVGGGGGGGRPGGDRRRIVAHDVRQREAGDPSGGRRAREPSPLETREVLADGVQLGDGGAGAQQRRSGASLVVEREALGRRGEEGRGAAGNEQQQQVVGTEGMGDRLHLVRGAAAG